MLCRATPTAKVIISTNQLPQFADKSMGIWRRMLFVPFERSYPPQMQNPHLLTRLEVELPGIFNWAYRGMRMLDQARRFIEPSKCTHALEQYRRDVNPARTFLLENYVKGLDFEGIQTQEVYDSYVAWCGENGYRPMNNANFGKEVKRTFPQSSKGQARKGGRKISTYRGLAVMENSPVATQAIQRCPQWKY
jgi:P4 family phage/plasmid primase-like protien